MKTLLLGTNNPGKIEELRSLLGDMQGWQLLSPSDIDLHLNIDETGTSYRANALIKARAYSKASGLITIADDSGLEVKALNDAPGLFSARYSPKKNANTTDRRQFLINQLRDHPQPWFARFVSTVCLLTSDGKEFFAEGECLGEIIEQERGEFGFGYDPIFLLSETQKTMAELNMQAKNSLSHRARAIATIKAQLQSL
jgi:XTP/dITP diphosphohydrolase